MYDLRKTMKITLHFVFLKQNFFSFSKTFFFKRVANLYKNGFLKHAKWIEKWRIFPRRVPEFPGNPVRSLGRAAAARIMGAATLHLHVPTKSLTSALQKGKEAG